MTLVTLRPGAVSTLGTSSGSGGSVVGGGGATLSDDSDTTYVSLPTDTDYFIAPFADLSLPAGAAIKTVALRARFANDGGPGTAFMDAYAYAGTFGGGGFTIGQAGIAVGAALISTQAIGSAGLGATDADVDGMVVRATRSSSAGSLAIRIYEAYLDVVYAVVPVVAVSTPTGTITTTNQPLVSWTDTLDPDGGAQTRWTVKIFNTAQFSAGGFDPETSTPFAVETGSDASLSRTLATLLPNDTYRAYVKVEQTINGAQLASAWAYSGFVINVTPPPTPTITATSDLPGGLRLTITRGGTTPSNDAFDLERSIDGGVTWGPVRTQFGLVSRILFALDLAPFFVTLYDYEPPNGAPTSYRARSLHNYSGLYAASAWGTVTATWDPGTWWLKHPNHPTLNVPVELVTYGIVTRAARQGIFQALGASLPIVVSDKRGGATGVAIIRTRTTAARDALQALVLSDGALMLQGPALAGEPDRYIRPGDLTVTRTVDNAGFSWREWALPWIEVAKPTGGTS